MTDLLELLGWCFLIEIAFHNKPRCCVSVELLGPISSSVDWMKLLPCQRDSKGWRVTISKEPGGGERDSLVPLLDECGGTVPLSSFEVR